MKLNFKTWHEKIISIYIQPNAQSFCYLSHSKNAQGIPTPTTTNKEHCMGIFVPNFYNSFPKYKPTETVTSKTKTRPTRHQLMSEKQGSKMFIFPVCLILLISNISTLNNKNTYFNAVIKPALPYGTNIWTTAPKENLNNIFTLQKRHRTMLIALVQHVKFASFLSKCISQQMLIDPQENT